MRTRHPEIPLKYVPATSTDVCAYVAQVLGNTHAPPAHERSDLAPWLFACAIGVLNTLVLRRVTR